MSVESEITRINGAVTEQTALIQEITDILEGKAGGGGSNTVFKIDEIYYAGTFELYSGVALHTEKADIMLSVNENYITDTQQFEEYKNIPFVDFEPFEIDITKDYPLPLAGDNIYKHYHGFAPFLWQCFLLCKKRREGEKTKHEQSKQRFKHKCKCRGVYTAPTT